MWEEEEEGLRSEKKERRGGGKKALLVDQNANGELEHYLGRGSLYGEDVEAQEAATISVEDSGFCAICWKKEEKERVENEEGEEKC